MLDSCTDFKDYIDLCIENGHTAIASTEHGKPLSWVEKKMLCDKAGIKFIHGVEIYLTERLDEKVRDNYHTVLLAKNYQGVLELNKLVSMSCNKEHFYYTNRISFDEFLGISNNIIKTSACLASPLDKLPDDHPRYLQLANAYDYLEVQAHNHPDQIAFNKRLVALSGQIGIPLICGTDTHSSSKYKAECRKILLKAKHKSYGDEDAFDLSYKTYDELVEIFKTQGALSESEVIDALENTNILADSVENFELDVSIKYPILYGSREADNREFVSRIERMFKEKLDSGIIPAEQEDAFRSAIDEELRIFQKLGMDGFMLSMSELTGWCRENNIAMGPARGSVGGSRVAYVTDITDVNPETWHTVFSRFCNEDRVEIGDIDIDVVDEDRPKIFDYIVSRFGARHTARVAAFGTLADKAAIDTIGKALRIYAEENGSSEKNPWLIPNLKIIKREYENNPDAARKKYKELFYYFDGLVNTRISQSVHPAGMVISPITLDDNYGYFDKDNDSCLMLDMGQVHDVGLAKYDFLVLKTVRVLRDAFNLIGKSYPRMHEIDWADDAVWQGIAKDPSLVFQFESDYANIGYRKFKPSSILEMSLVNAAIRPSGASYKDRLFARKRHKNPSALIDDLFKDNYGYLVYQEDVIKFLQEICGLSGSEADTVRKAIGRKQADKLQAALPKILNGYCDKSQKSRKEAEEEATGFLKVIEDASDYMFNYNHSIAYCMLGYLFGYLRYYYPYETLTAYLNNAANDDDIENGSAYAQKNGIKITMPKWGISRGDYYFNAEKHTIAKGLASVKYMSAVATEELFELSQGKQYMYFVDLLRDISHETCVDARQLNTLIHIDFFSDFGNQRELLRLVDLFSLFKAGAARQIKKSQVDGTELEEAVRKHAVGTTKSGGVAKSYTLLDVMAILRDLEVLVKKSQMEDLSDVIKVQNFYDAMGYVGYVSGKEDDRRKLIIMEVYPLRRKSDSRQFGHSIVTKSIGSGKDSRFTVFNRVFEDNPVKAGDIIFCKSYTRDGQYYQLTSYDKLY